MSNTYTIILIIATVMTIINIFIEKILSYVKSRSQSSAAGADVANKIFLIDESVKMLNSKREDNQDKLHIHDLDIAKLQSNINEHTNDIINLHASRVKTDESVQSLSLSVARIEETVKTIPSMDEKLDRLIYTKGDK